MGGRTPPQGIGRIPGQAPSSIRERVGALRNLPPFLKLVWQTSPAISVALIVLRLIRALLPVATLYVGALIIDAVVANIPSGNFDPIWPLLVLEFSLAVLSDVLGRGVSLLDSLLGERFSIATSLRLMQHAATLDLEDFEDSEVQDRLERARQQASGRTGLMSQLFNQAQDVVTIVSFGAGLFVYAPGLLRLVAGAPLPAPLRGGGLNPPT